MQLLLHHSPKAIEPMEDRNDVTLPAILEFQSPSTALHNAYSYPNETALTALSAPQPLNCAGK